MTRNFLYCEFRMSERPDRFLFFFDKMILLNRAVSVKNTLLSCKRSWRRFEIQESFGLCGNSLIFHLWQLVQMAEICLLLEVIGGGTTFVRNIFQLHHFQQPDFVSGAWFSYRRADEEVLNFSNASQTAAVWRKRCNLKNFWTKVVLTVSWMWEPQSPTF